MRVSPRDPGVTVLYKHRAISNTTKNRLLSVVCSIIIFGNCVCLSLSPFIVIYCLLTRFSLTYKDLLTYLLSCSCSFKTMHQLHVNTSNFPRKCIRGVHLYMVCVIFSLSFLSLSLNYGAWNPEIVMLFLPTNGILIVTGQILFI